MVKNLARFCAIYIFSQFYQTKSYLPNICVYYFLWEIKQAIVLNTAIGVMYGKELTLDRQKIKGRIWYLLQIWHVPLKIWCAVVINFVKKGHMEGTLSLVRQLLNYNCLQCRFY